MQLTKEEYDFLISWIHHNFVPKKTISEEVCALLVHTIFEHFYDKGFYVDEATIAKALIECGYTPMHRNGQIYFNISKKSRAVQIYYASLGDPSKVHSFQWL